MTLEMERVDDLRWRGKAQRPFDKIAGFTSDWWSGVVSVPVSWCWVIDPIHGEVARAELRHESRVGGAYPTWEIPAEGALQIHLLEVRDDLRRSGIGLRTLAMIQERFDGPYVALSRDEDSDGFWRRSGWREHDHEETVQSRGGRVGAPYMQLFTYPS